MTAKGDRPVAVRRIATYTIPEAAHYLGVPIATVRSWTLGQHYGGRARFKPVIAIAQRRPPLLAYLRRIELTRRVSP